MKRVILPAHIRAAKQAHSVNSLLTKTNPKVMKNNKEFNIPTVVMHLLPKYRGTCPFAATCASICLNKSGNPMHLRGKLNARKNRTDFFCDDRNAFMELLLIELIDNYYHELLNVVDNPDLEQLAARLNGTSDNRWELESFDLTHEVSEYIWEKYNKYIAPGHYPNIMTACNANAPIYQFYDYTKRPDRNIQLCDHLNYHLTYSSGSSADVFRSALDHGKNLACAFNVKKSQPLPETVTIASQTFKVIDGDVSDCRFLDPSDTTHVVGLRLKRVPGMTQEQIKSFCIA